MRKCSLALLLLIILFWTGKVFAQDEKDRVKDDTVILPGQAPLAPLTIPDVVVSSYFNSTDPRDEWSELLVITDNTDMRNWRFKDNNSSQTSFQDSILFLNIPFWNNMRAGTIIIIRHRQYNSSGVLNPLDVSKADGFISVHANDPNYFSGGSFGNAPSFAGATLNVAAAGDLLQLTKPSGSNMVHVHVLGHKSTPGSSWNPIPLPKLNHQATIVNEAVMVCPGGSIDEYGNTAPQTGTAWTATSGAAPAGDFTLGLPNKTTAYPTQNSLFWRSTRQPAWSGPALTGTVNASNTIVTLTWNASTDPNPSDGTQGYIILRNTVNTFTAPVDGHTYAAGNNLGGATVMAIVPSSPWDDNTAVPCTSGFYYQVYAYRYTTDEPNGNDYDPARGRAYNETSFGSAHVIYPLPLPPVSASSDRNNFCADDQGTITLSATGGSGTVINWYTGSCGGTFIGTGTGVNNSITIPSPASTTTYYVRWENACGTSPCASITVNVIQNLPVSVTIAPDANPVCQNTPVTFTAVPANGGTPIYQWYVNSAATGTGLPTFTYTPANGDQVWVVMTSDAACAIGNPATSNIVTMIVNQGNPVSVTVTATPNDTVCSGTSVTFIASPLNEGPNPVYQWYLNGLPVGSNSTSYTYIPSDLDEVHCTVNSSMLCATNNPATSNSIIISIAPDLPVSVTLTADPGNSVCEGASVTFTANPFNEGDNPSYQWYLNSGAVGTGATTFTYSPVNGDQVWVVMTSNAPCATGNPATSNTIIMTVIPNSPVSLIITATPNDTVCPGTSVTFAASAENGGANPIYQWYLNGAPVGTGGPTYTRIPSNFDEIYCTVNSNITCPTNNPATSNSIIISISGTLPVSATVTAVPGNSVCTGTTVSYTVNAVNGGTSPSYQWYLNDNPVGTNNPTYSNVPSNADRIYCKLTSSLGCATNNPANSNTITISITSFLPVGITIAADPGSTVCEGSTVTFTATAENGGNIPSYQWFVNGTATGTNNLLFSHIPSAGDQISCKVTSDLSCATNNPATSNTITISFTPASPVSANITAFPGTSVCAGTQVTFTAIPVNGGTAPVFHWYLNNVSAGNNSPTFVTIPVNGDQLYCKITSDLDCTSNNPANSNTMTMTIATDLPVSANLSAKPGISVCEGSPVTFTVLPVNGGSTPAYAWYLNNSPTGSNSDSLVLTPANGDKVYCMVTSSFSCASNNPASTNTITILTSNALEVTVNVTATPASVCQGQTLTYTATAVNEGNDPVFEWIVDGVLLQSGTSAVFVTDSVNGAQSVVCKLTSSLTCTKVNPVQSVPLTVPVNLLPVVNLSDKPYLCTQPDLELDAGPGYTSYLWQDGSSDRYIHAADKGLYWVRVEDTNGCPGSDTLLVEECMTQVLIPNAFSPNGDGNNDTFRVVINPDLINHFSMNVFNRWGELVFESNNIKTGWDGKYKGEPADAGIYIYIIHLTTAPSISAPSEEQTFKGSLTLIR